MQEHRALARSLAHSPILTKAMRSIAVTFRGKRYTGEYEVLGKTVRVFFRENAKTGLMRSSDPELMARLLLIELLSRVLPATGNGGSSQKALH